MNPCNSTTACLERQVQVCRKRMANTSRAPKTERNHQAKQIGCSASAVSVLQPLTLRIGVQAHQLRDKGRQRCSAHGIDEANDQEAKGRSEAQPRSAGRSKTRHGLWFKAKVQQHARQAMMRKTKNGNKKESRQGRPRQGRSKAGSSNGSINQYH